MNDALQRTGVHWLVRAFAVLVLLAAVTAFLAALERQRKDAMVQAAKFADTMLEFANKPCLMESAQGAAIMQQALNMARQRGEMINQ